MNERGTLLFVFLLGWMAAMPLKAQSCRSESEIPSTAPAVDFIDNGDGTVTQISTHLMWQKCPVGLSGDDCTQGGVTALDWRDALNRAVADDLAGHHDWRLPNLKELRAIVEQRCYGPAIDLEVFPNTGSNTYWTGTSQQRLGTQMSAYAWVVDFKDGTSRNYSKNGTLLLRLVRDLP